MRYPRFRYLPVVLCCVLSACPGAADDVPDASPSGDYSRDLEIPDIVRFRTLPQRWDLEPHFEAPGPVSVSEKQYTLFFARLLQSAESVEIQQQAAEFLGSLARDEREDIGPALETLRSRMESTESLRVRHSCAMALLAADDRDSAPLFLEMLPDAEESTRNLIEPALIRWKRDEAVPVWMQRLNDPFTTTAGYRNAAAGLTALEHRPAVAAFSAAVADVAVPFSRRMAAARAVAALDPAAGRERAGALATGAIPDRLLCVAMLSSSDEESIRLLVQLCSDDAGAVAASAWNTLLELRPDALIPLLDAGRRHFEPTVRMAAGEVMRQMPTDQHCTWLVALAGDTHIGVRNAARSSLCEVALRDAGHQRSIVAAAEEILQSTGSPWQHIEQALVLLSQLKQPQTASLCVPLLNHPRGEVAVTAAWVMHLFPAQELLSAAIREVRQREGWLKAYEQPPGELTSTDVGLQVGYLFQMCGLLRDGQLEEEMTEQFSKAAPGGPIKRAAAMWALGLLHEDDPDSPLVEQMVDRILDMESLDPEAVEVRRACIISVGRMRALQAKPALQEAFENDSVEVLVPQSVRWVLQLLDQPAPELPPPSYWTPPGFRLESLRDDHQ